MKYHRFVEIVRRDQKTVEERHGPFDHVLADRKAYVFATKLDHKTFYLRITDHEGVELPE